MRVLGIAGWSGAGKTTALVSLIPVLVGRGLRVATLKHAHHDFDVDVPGKDSWRHRQAGASQVIVASARRWVQIHELREAAEPGLATLLAQIEDCDLVLVEGYKRDPLPKLEIHRPAVGKPALYLQDAHVRVVATDVRGLPDCRLPQVDLNDPEALADAVLQHALPRDEVLQRLAAAQVGDSTSATLHTRPGSVAE